MVRLELAGTHENVISSLNWLDLLTVWNYGVRHRTGRAAKISSCGCLLVATN